MIDHNNKVIFVHIARTGGSTVENMFMGQDYWLVNPSEKHIPARIARHLYEPYWSDYYKFAIVRNPFDRFRSLWKYADHYGLELNDDGEIEIDKYLGYWKYPEVVEVNRYSPFNLSETYKECLRPKEESLYQNLLCDGVQVFKFEYLPMVLRTLNERFELGFDDFPKVENSIKEKPPLSQRAIRKITEIHLSDFERFDYSKSYTN